MRVANCNCEERIDKRVSISRIVFFMFTAGIVALGIYAALEQ